MVSRWDVSNARWGYYNVVMYWIFEDSNRQSAYGIDRTLQRNLRLFSFFLWIQSK